MKYETKHVIIEAVEWTGNNEEEIKKFAGDKIIFEESIGGSEDGNGYPQKYVQLKIKTLEGVMTAQIGDFIIKGLRGEFYPCKPDVFHEKYREVK